MSNYYKEKFPEQYNFGYNSLNRPNKADFCHHFGPFGGSDVIWKACERGYEDKLEKELGIIEFTNKLELLCKEYNIKLSGHREEMIVMYKDGKKFFLPESEYFL